MIPLRPTSLIAIVLFLCVPQSYCAAQDKKSQFPKVGVEDFKPINNPIVDSSSSAVILYDRGYISFIGNAKGWFSYVYQRRTRIRVLSKKAFDVATVAVQLRERDDDAEKADNIVAVTYNLDNGAITESHLDKKDIFEDREDKYHKALRFTLPAVREGSIIEYTYTITSDFYFTLPDWDFQSVQYPCLNSEYEVEIPQALFYVVVKQGIHPYAVDKGSEGHASYSVKTRSDGGLAPVSNDLFVTANTTKHRWVMKDVPAMREDSYITNPNNYTDKIELQLSRTYDGRDFHDVMNTWKVATDELLKREDFGQPLSEDNVWLDDLLTKIVANASDPLQQAKAIYYYLQEHMTCTNHYNKYIRTNLRDVVKKNSGSVGDLNLLLIAMLRKKGFNAEPVLLSTREYGFNLAKYPILDRLNYVIARLTLAGKIYYLDIAHPQLGFGQLDGKCYNGHARIISATDSGSVYFEADSLHEKKTTMVFLTSTGKGMDGTYQSNMDLLSSYHVRQRVREMGEKEYFKRMQTAYGDDVIMSNTHIDSLDRKEDPVNVRYDFSLRQGAGESMIYLNPFFGEGVRENPFRAVERKYPVEMPHTTDDIYLLNLEVPKGYVVEELPRSTRVELNGDQGLFEYLIAKQDDMIQLRCRLRLDKATFSPDDYTNLRDFFAFIVKKENEQIVLKKQ